MTARFAIVVAGGAGFTRRARRGGKRTGVDLGLKVLSHIERATGQVATRVLA